MNKKTMAVALSLLIASTAHSFAGQQPVPLPACSPSAPMEQIRLFA